MSLNGIHFICIPVLVAGHLKVQYVALGVAITKDDKLPGAGWLCNLT